VKKTLIFFLIILLSMAACTQGEEEASPQGAAEISTQEITSPTHTPEPTATEVPPTDTPIPTETPLPTSTNTPLPTDTPTITPTFSPETLNFEAGEPLKLGYLLWETHALGIDALRGIEIAIEDFGGELFGHPIELVGFNSECNELAAQRGSQILVQDDNVVGIIGTICTRGALRAAPIVTDGGRVMISPANTIPELTVPEDRAAGYFRTAPNDLYQVIAVAQYAYHDLGIRKFATVYTAGDKILQLVNETFCEEFTALGGECVLQKTNQAGNAYMQPVVNSLIEAAAESVFFIGWDNGVATALITAMKETPELADSPVFLWQAYYTPSFLEVSGENAVGVYVAATSLEIKHSGAYNVFLETYQKEYGQEPISEFHSYAYDAAKLLLTAIQQVAVQGEDGSDSGSLMVDPLAVREALYILEVQGLTGLISCSPDGDCASRSEGKVYEFTSGDPGTFNPGPADMLSSNPSQVWP
jgi:branched-chain amino acid transport system substrate-binding protein